MMNGKRPHMGAPIDWNICGLPSNTNLSSTRSTTGTTSSRAIVRGSRRICQSTRLAIAEVTRAFTMGSVR